MKTKEELIVLKEEVEALKAKFAELNEEELAQVTGGFLHSRLPSATSPSIVLTPDASDKIILG